MLQSMEGGGGERVLLQDQEFIVFLLGLAMPTESNTFD